MGGNRPACCDEIANHKNSSNKCERPSQLQVHSKNQNFTIVAVLHRSVEANERQGLYLGLSVWATQLRRNVTAVADFAGLICPALESNPRLPAPIAISLTAAPSGTSPIHSKTQKFLFTPMGQGCHR